MKGLKAVLLLGMAFVLPNQAWTEDRVPDNLGSLPL